MRGSGWRGQGRSAIVDAVDSEAIVVMVDFLVVEVEGVVSGADEMGATEMGEEVVESECGVDRGEATEVRFFSSKLRRRKGVPLPFV
jgi:hypothetical protein